MRNSGTGPIAPRAGAALLLGAAALLLSACGRDSESASRGRKGDSEDPQVERLRKELARLEQEISRSDQARTQAVESARREERIIAEREIADLKAQLRERPSPAEGNPSAPPAALSDRPAPPGAAPGKGSLAEKGGRAPILETVPDGLARREGTPEAAGLKVMGAREQEGFLKKLEELSLAIGEADDPSARDRALREREDWALDYLNEHGWGFRGWKGEHVLVRRSHLDRNLWQWTLRIAPRASQGFRLFLEQDGLSPDSELLAQIQDLRVSRPVRVSGRWVRREGRLVHSTLNLDHPDRSELHPKIYGVIQAVEVLREE